MWEGLGIAPADVLLPNCDLSKWSVIACDQYTAQYDYWKRVEETVGEAPSALRMILPEAYLHRVDVDGYINQINETMCSYRDSGLFRHYENTMIYVERQVSTGGIRRGLVCKLDLEEYDFEPGSEALIRATEKTVLERIPPRVHIREHATLELPHVMILVDDTKEELIAPLENNKCKMEQLYSFELMENGGKIAGWRVDQESMNEVAHKLANLRETTEMLFAVGDGNHSLAAAKTIYENEKKQVPENEWASLPSRWALVEVVSLNDPGVVFLPIHRIVLGVDGEKMMRAFAEYYPTAEVGEGDGHVIRWCCQNLNGVLTVKEPENELAVETLQKFLDDYVSKNGGTIDYIHDEKVVEEMSIQTRTIGFLLPEFPRETMFPYVQKHGALPRKTFSIGHSEDKRYYLEARKISG